MFNAACSKLNSSFSYTIFFVSPKLFNGLPRRLKTACRFGSRLFVIEPLAESPSVMKMQLSSRLSPFVSFRWIRQSRSFLLCQVGLLCPFAGQLGHTGDRLAFFFRFLDLTQQGVRCLCVLVQVVVQFLLDEVPDKLADRRSVRSPCLSSLTWSLSGFRTPVLPP